MNACEPPEDFPVGRRLAISRMMPVKNTRPTQRIPRRNRSYCRAYKHGSEAVARAVQQGATPGDVQAYVDVVGKWASFPADRQTPPPEFWRSVQFEGRRRETLRAISHIERRER